MSTKKSDFTEKAIIVLDGLKGELDTDIALLDSGNKAVLHIWAMLKVGLQAFIADTGVEKGKAWDLYFKPELEKRYPKRGWGSKTKDSYFRVIKDEKKTKEYLAGEFELSSGRKKAVAKLTDEKKLEKIVTAFNNVVNKITENGKKIKAAVDSKGIITATIE